MGWLIMTCKKQLSRPGLGSARRASFEDGFTLAGALVILAVLAIFLLLAVPLWTRIKQRDNEEELIFRGKEYVKAINRYQLKFHTFPPDLETLVKLKMIRKLYLDPMTKSGKWKVLHPQDLVQTGKAGVIGTQTQPLVTGGGQKEEPQTQSGDLNKEDQDQDNPGLSDEDKKKQEDPEVDSTGPVVGVVSRSRKDSIKILDGQSK